MFHTETPACLPSRNPDGLGYLFFVLFSAQAEKQRKEGEARGRLPRRRSPQRVLRDNRAQLATKPLLSAGPPQPGPGGGNETSARPK